VTAKSLRGLLALGANLGDPLAQLTAAVDRLHQSRISVLSTSALYSTLPAGGPSDQKPYLNAAVAVQTDLTPMELLHAACQIEKAACRVRVQPWGSRTLDIDLLLIEGEVLLPNTTSRLAAPEELVLPHARMAWRRFVMDPAAEIEPDWIHPLLGCSLQSLQQRLVNCPHCALVAGDPRQSDRLHRRLEMKIGESVCNANLVTNPTTFHGVRMVVIVDRLELLDKATAKLWATGTPAIGISMDNEDLAVKELVAAIQAAQEPTSVEPWSRLGL
jgi:2-amino-4-hydroxy-6-hydroxymethyldihydropteridine diphosphokinase